MVGDFIQRLTEETEAFLVETGTQQAASRAQTTGRLRGFITNHFHGGAEYGRTNSSNRFLKDPSWLFSPPKKLFLKINFWHLRAAHGALKQTQSFDTKPGVPQRPCSSHPEPRALGLLQTCSGGRKRRKMLKSKDDQKFLNASRNLDWWLVVALQRGEVKISYTKSPWCQSRSFLIDTRMVVEDEGKQQTAWAASGSALKTKQTVVRRVLKLRQGSHSTSPSSDHHSCHNTAFFF